MQVDDHKVAVAGKVKVGGQGTKTAEANKANVIDLDLSEAGTSCGYFELSEQLHRWVDV